MNRYKLIKQYPGSLPEGTIVIEKKWLDGDVYNTYYETLDGKNKYVDKLILSFPEYWRNISNINVDVMEATGSTVTTIRINKTLTLSIGDIIYDKDILLLGDNYGYFILNSIDLNNNYELEFIEFITGQKVSCSITPGSHKEYTKIGNVNIESYGKTKNM